MPVPHSPPWLRFQSPLIEPDMRISRILCCRTHKMRYVVISIMWRSPRHLPSELEDGGEVRHIMREAYRAARKDSNSLFACQFGVCSGSGSEPETAHVCNAFAFISRSTSA